MTKLRKFLLAGGIALAVAVPTGVAVAETGGPDGSSDPQHQMGQHEGDHQMGDHQMGDHQMGDHQMGDHQMGDHQAGHDGTCPHAGDTDTSA